MLAALNRISLGAEHQPLNGGPDDDCLFHCSSLHQFAESLGHAVDAKDPQTFNHSLEVAEISQILALKLGFNKDKAQIIHVAAHLHDIGKIGIPDGILQKKEPLNEVEWHWIKKHPDIGARILRPVIQFNNQDGISDMVRHHHERFDGTGYPCGLKGFEIPIGARIIAVADTLSALLQNRPYRSGTDLSKALAEIQRCAGSQFDPKIVAALLAVRSQLVTVCDMRPCTALAEKV